MAPGAAPHVRRWASQVEAAVVVGAEEEEVDVATGDVVALARHEACCAPQKEKLAF